MNFPRIRLLSSEISNQIAAGEVVERPASVVKELLENSLDAGSQDVEVRLEEGGIRLIQVSDDGHGIHPDDLKLALQQHATSKIESTEDLFGIESLGFRGEALASIAAVSQLEITSRVAESDHAWKISTQNPEEIAPCARNQGTTVRMENLFYNVPARKKFLRRPNTEYHQVEACFKRIALSAFSVRFRLVQGERVIHQLPRCENVDDCARRVQKVCGAHFVENALYIDAEQNGLHLWGWMGLPLAAKSHLDEQHFFVNRRVIRDRLISHAIRQVYLKFCEPGRYPNYCLYLELDPTSVDVNVHPTKQEVRFSDARIVHGFLSETLFEALSRVQEPMQTGMEPSMEIKKSPLPSRMQVSHLKSDWGREQWGAHSQLEMQPLALEEIQSSSHGTLLACIGERYALVDHEGAVYVLDVTAWYKQRLQMLLHSQWKGDHFAAEPLLIPQSVVVSCFKNDAEACIEDLKSLGFEASMGGTQQWILRGLPSILVGLDVDYPDLLKKSNGLMKASGPLSASQSSPPEPWIDLLVRFALQASEFGKQTTLLLQRLDEAGWTRESLQKVPHRHLTERCCQTLF